MEDSPSARTLIETQQFTQRLLSLANLSNLELASTNGVCGSLCQLMPEIAAYPNRYPLVPGSAKRQIARMNGNPSLSIVFEVIDQNTILLIELEIAD